MKMTSELLHWQRVGYTVDWFKPFTKIKNVSFHSPVSIKWFEDGELNACFNCVDRHLPKYNLKKAIIWQGDIPDQSFSITYKELADEVQKWTQVLRHLNVQKGDRVTIYMPMLVETIFAMLACARLGAIHSVVFGGFSAEALAKRINDCQSQLIITADHGQRGNKIIPLKQTVDQALKMGSHPCQVLVVDRRLSIHERLDKSQQHMEKYNPVALAWNPQTDMWFHQVAQQVSQLEWIQCERMSAEDPLFLLYTSGSTGQPKGLVHTTGGYMAYATWTFKEVFDYKKQDIYWCTADVGWVTGHTYLVYGPLANAATIVIYEGVPTYPDATRFWQEIDRHQVNIFYTAPTAIRSLIQQGDHNLEHSQRTSLRILGTVGEPINSAAWDWYYKKVGKERCPVIDTWWQTETGGIMIAPTLLPFPQKAGCASKPLTGIQPVLLNADKKEVSGPGEGHLCIKDSWPGQARSIYKDHSRFEETYFSTYPGFYFTGDGARRDAEGDYWLTGRVDDVVNVSGHRLGTAELESAINSHSAVAESAVVGFPHEVKGQGLWAFVILKTDTFPELIDEIRSLVRQKIGPIAHLDEIQFVPGLPKTRSGKIMRRILRKIAASDTENLGDISTLADPQVVEYILHHCLRS